MSTVIERSPLAALVAAWEGFRDRAYLCPAGVPTIGHGRTEGVNMGDVTTRAAEDAWLQAKLDDLALRVRQLTAGCALLQHQIDALVSFAFNVGTANLERSTLLKKIRAGDLEAAAREFGRWNKARVNGELRPLRGLTLRRADERELFEFADYARGPRDPAETAEGMPREVGAEATADTADAVSIGGAGVGALAVAVQQGLQAWQSFKEGVPEDLLPIATAALCVAGGAYLLRRAWAFYRQHRASPV